MNKKEAIRLCHEHREEYVRGASSVDDGIRQFDCLIALLEDDFINPDELSDYGMEIPELSQEGG